MPDESIIVMTFQVGLANKTSIDHMSHMICLLHFREALSDVKDSGILQNTLCLGSRDAFEKNEEW